MHQRERFDGTASKNSDRGKKKKKVGKVKGEIARARAKPISRWDVGRGVLHGLVLAGASVPWAKSVIKHPSRAAKRRQVDAIGNCVNFT